MLPTQPHPSGRLACHCSALSRSFRASLSHGRSEWTQRFEVDQRRLPQPGAGRATGPGESTRLPLGKRAASLIFARPPPWKQTCPPRSGQALPALKRDEKSGCASVWIMEVGRNAGSIDSSTTECPDRADPALSERDGSAPGTRRLADRRPSTPPEVPRKKGSLGYPFVVVRSGVELSDGRTSCAAR